MGQLFGRKKSKDCCCPGDICCPGRCNPVADEVCDNPLPETVTCTMTVSTVKNDPITGVPTDCYTVTGTLFLSPTGGWIGLVEGTCTGWCGGTTRIFQYTCTLDCAINPDNTRSWYIVVEDYITGDSSRSCTAPFSDPPVWSLLSGTCDPILLVGSTAAFTCNDLVCIIPMLGIDEVFGEVVFDVLITEDP